MSADDLPEGEATPARDRLDDMADGVTAGELTQAIEPLLRPLVLAIVRDGPEAAMNKAAELYHDLDDAALTEMLTRAIFIADLWGRIDATDR